jgi:microcystin-dependent protein
MEGTMSEIRLFAGNFAPRTWATCDGQLIAISTNQALFSLLGTTFGGDGRVTFALPDLRGRAAVGIGTTTQLGTPTGTATVTLNVQQLPGHVHQTQASLTPAFKVSSAVSDSAAPTAGCSFAQMGTAEGRGAIAAVNAYSATDPDTTLNAASVVLAPVVEAPSGGSQPHNNMQPWIGVPHIICLQGIYPSRS